jgi:hypothetical protein
MLDRSVALLGSWRLVSFETELQATGERIATLGKNPTGYLVFGADLRMMAVITGDGRKAAETDTERAALMRSMVAYTGIYRIEDDRFITKVDASWNEAWTGTEQVRFFKLDGDRLDITAAWQPSTVLPGRPVTRGIIGWRRMQP